MRSTPAKRAPFWTARSATEAGRWRPVLGYGEPRHGLLVQNEADSGSLGHVDLPVARAQALGQDALEVVDVLFEPEVLDGQTVAGGRGQVDVQVGVPVGR